MNTTHISTDKGHGKLSLYQLVENNIKRYLNAAKSNSNSLINNVSDKMNVHADELIIGSIIGGLLNAVITHVRESHIYITAKEVYGKMIEINVKDDNCYNTYAVALSLQDVVKLAERIGGQLDISNQRQKITTITFRFPFSK
jgi:hypothetical protein